jgi:hypothetical protein
MNLGFVRPSVSRAVSWIIAVAAVCCVIGGIALYVGLIVTHHDAEHTSAGEHLRLLVVCIVFYAPMYILIPWWLSIPAILFVGTLAASVRRNPAADTSSEHVILPSNH